MIRPPILMTLILWLVPPCLQMRQEQVDKVEQTTSVVFSAVWDFVSSYHSDDSNEPPTESPKTP